MKVTTAQLHRLANLYSIKTSYLDADKLVRSASSAALLAVLKALGAPVEVMKDVPSALREKQQQYWQQSAEPVLVVWENEILTVNLRLPASLMESSLNASLIMENGVAKNFVWRVDGSSVLDSIELEGSNYVTARLYFPERLPQGYHRLKLELKGRIVESLIISAPLKAYHPAGVNEKIWGAFLPLYSLRTQSNWGAGDFADLSTLIEWVSGLEGKIVGTLPLLPSFFDEKFGPGPYMPASRLFWNEFYINIDHIPELTHCPSAQTLINSTEFQKEITSLRKSRRVDYQRVLSLKRQILEQLAHYFFSEKPSRFSDLQNVIQSDNRVRDYARFRAAGERHGILWDNWPERMCRGKLLEGDYAPETEQYYLFTQWLAEEQIKNICREARRTNTFLYLDLPVGVHPYSYDVWRERESFVREVNGGAPPDPVFTSGQNWSFPPLHPEKIRQQGYGYVIASLRHQLKQAGMLRIDHIMHFHRLFWIPREMENQDGVYVGYKAEELYAILTLESCRNKSIIIGEDLGMVPPDVRPMMGKHDIFRMFIGQYELIAENHLGKIPSHAVAGLNTHDMFPFAAFWEEIDIEERQKLKLIGTEIAHQELAQRRQIKRALISILQYRGLNNEVSQDTQTTLIAVLNLLAASPAYAFLANLEDLWLETHPQNVPGTRIKQNWSQKARCTFEQFSKSPAVLEIIQEINRSRKGACVQL